MPIELYVSKDRNIYITNQPDISSSNIIGVTGENNATVLRFSFFEELNGKSVSDFRKRLVAILPEGVLKYELNGDLRLPRELTASEELTVLVEIFKGEDVLFKSYPHTFYLIDSGDKAESNLIQTAVDSIRESCRAELETSIETATGENHDNKTWEELNNTVAELPIITDEQTQALGDYDLFKDYFAGINGDGANYTHNLFSMPPRDENGNVINYRLPYIYTPNMEWHRHIKAFCAQLLEVGIDVTKARSVGGESAPFATQKLQRLVMTGNANALTLTYFMYNAFELSYIKLETPNAGVLELEPAYYTYAFYRCEKLRTIDCELDFTGQTNTLNMFFKCFLLKDLRIKPFTLSTSLDLGDCRSLHHNDLNDYESLISILNAITDDTELAKNVTITFSNEITDFTTGGVHYWNALVYHCDNGIFYADPSEVPEGYAYLELPLYDAFIVKGVTIAWK